MMLAVRPRTLIIDDEEAIRDACTQVLAKEGHIVETAANGIDVQVCPGSEISRNRVTDATIGIRAITASYFSSVTFNTVWSSDYGLAIGSSEMTVANNLLTNFVNAGIFSAAVGTCTNMAFPATRF